MKGGDDVDDGSSEKGMSSVTGSISFSESDFAVLHVEHIIASG